MNKRWPRVKLGEVIRQRKEFVTIDDLTTYKRPRVKLHVQGIVLRDELPGALIKTKKQQVCRSGEFLVAEIDAKVGGFGIVPDALDGAIVSSHYFLFVVNEQVLDRRFLDWYIHTPQFKDQVEAQGSTNYAAIRPSDVLNYEIPLPPMAEQQRIVAKIDQLAAKIAEARSLRQNAAEEGEALFARARADRFSTFASDFPNRPLGELISMASGKGLTSSQMDESAPYLVYGGGGLTGRYTRYLFETPKIVIGRVGARCGCVFVTEPMSWVTDNALYLAEVSPALDSPYLVHALTMLDLRQQANQAAQPVVSQKKINPLTIPVPPLQEQHRIVAELNALQVKTDALKRLQADSAFGLDALLPSILDKAFKGEL
jgi:type I restriction enzyme S subunit